MRDEAQIIMATGGDVAIGTVKSVNENMSQLHYHDYFEIYILKQGERYHYVGDNLIRSDAGDILFFPPSVMHRSYSKPNVEFERTVIYFRPEVILSNELRDALYNSSSLYKAEKNQIPMINSFIQRLTECQTNHAKFDDVQIISIVNLLCSMVLKMHVEGTGHLEQNRTSQIIAYINKNFDKDISLTEIANEFHISEFYLCREFKKETNRTIIDFVKQTRIMNAEFYFKDTDKNVSEVAALTGFSNLTHFNRVFKEFLGITPSQYRKKIKEEKQKMNH